MCRNDFIRELNHNTKGIVGGGSADGATALLISGSHTGKQHSSALGCPKQVFERYK